MCGRYSLATDKQIPVALQQIQIILGLETVPIIKSRYNIAPQQLAPVTRVRDGQRAWEDLRWGFRPTWLGDRNRAQINARAETVFESRGFKPSTLHRRCLVPASGW